MKNVKYHIYNRYAFLEHYGCLFIFGHPPQHVEICPYTQAVALTVGNGGRHPIIRLMDEIIQVGSSVIN